METALCGRFATRREAELAVEHLVQDHGVDRSAVTIRPEGDENSAGTVAAGADTESGHPGLAKHGRPKLSGRIEVRVAVSGRSRQTLGGVLRELGGELGD